MESTTRLAAKLEPSPANSIDEVIDRLTAIVGTALKNGSRQGYFAALYRKVTLRVRDGIRSGVFENPERMERFDVIFANRYLEACLAFEAGAATSSCWRLAFESTADYWPIVLQHLLLGMNAHINLDLGIAAAVTMRGSELEAIHGDFNKINDVLAALVKEVQTELAEVWLALKLMNRFLGNIDDAVVNFSMRKARDEAWQAAQRFSALSDDQWAEAILLQDSKALMVGKLVRYPGTWIDFATRIIRIGEVQSTRKVIGILA